MYSVYIIDTFALNLESNLLNKMLANEKSWSLRHESKSWDLWPCNVRLGLGAWNINVNMGVTTMIKVIYEYIKIGWAAKILACMLILYSLGSYTNNEQTSFKQ